MERQAPRITFRRLFLSTLLSIIGLHAGLFLLIGAFCGLYSFANPRLTTLMIYRGLWFNYKIQPIQFVRLKEMPRYVPRMFVKVEDSNFYTHPGIDLKAIQDSYRINNALGYIYRGGSTISQQLARTLFLTPARSYLRKYMEAWIALEMDLLLSKNRLLELYINTIEYGQGVFGIGAASRHHYKKSAAKLGLDEYRRLVTIIASPLKYNTKNFTRHRALLMRYQFLCQTFQ